jgi:hypothetical protein
MMVRLGKSKVTDPLPPFSVTTINPGVRSRGTPSNVVYTFEDESHDPPKRGAVVCITEGHQLVKAIPGFGW